MKGSLCRLAETSFLWRDTATRIRERFNPRAPCGARLPGVKKFGRGPYFNPRAPCGARRAVWGGDRRVKEFQPTRPLRGATSATAAIAARRREFQPTRPLRGATFYGLLVFRSGFHISTHAPLAGRDVDGGAGALGQNISTHAPLAGRDRVPADSQGRCTGISTHAPLAGRDNAHKGCRADQKYFNPRAPCGARPLITMI